jgi:hypothetical protein
MLPLFLLTFYFTAPLQEDDDEEQDVMFRGKSDGIFAEESSISDDDEDIELIGVPNPASRSAPEAANFAKSVLESNGMCFFGRRFVVNNEVDFFYVADRSILI